MISNYRRYMLRNRIIVTRKNFKVLKDDLKGLFSRDILLEANINAKTIHLQETEQTDK